MIVLNEIIKNRVGRTPLIRACKLEKEIGIKKIYLKLEGNNPSGHIEDRLAYLLIRDAIARGKKTICMGTYGTIGGSLSYLSKYFDIKCVFYVPSKKRISRKLLVEEKNVKIIEYGRTYNDCVRESRRVSQKNKWYNANFGLANSVTNMYAVSYVAKELHEQLEKNIDSVFCQTFNGSSISGLHLGFKELWVNEEIEALPKIWAVTTENGNAILESYKQQRKEILALNPKTIKRTRYSRHMVNANCQNGQEALNAIYDSYGGAIGVTDEELVTHAKHIKAIEKLELTPSNAFPLAGFIKAVEQGNISNGNHVLILDDGKSKLDIRILKKNDLNISYKEFMKTLDDWLMDFTDPAEEINEAVDNAFEHGYVIGAFDHKILVGIVVVSRTRFETFFPKYHLSYIATKKGVKGRGIATQLLQKAIEVSDGDLSLHVETNNKRAIKLYEKMGLRKKYYRMLYAGK